MAGYTDTSENQFATAILTFGALSVITVFTGIFPSLLGGIGLILCVVGHKKGSLRTPGEMLGMVLCATGIVLGIAMVVLAFVSILLPYYNDPELFAQINEVYKNYGIDLQGMIEGMMPVTQ